MKSTGDVLSEAFYGLGSPDHIPANEGDYIGPDGMLHCGLCREGKEYRLPNGNYVPALCACGRKRRASEELRRMELAQMQRVRELAQYSIMDERQKSATFAAARMTEDSRKPLHVAQKYVERWAEISRDELNGLLFYGPTGTGKSYIAACIANALMDKNVPVLMTSIVKLTGFHQDEMNEILRLMKRAHLLILDDLGAERGTDFKLEQVYNIIDERCNSKKPMVVTTNLSMDEMKNAGDMRYNRIWERVRSMCYPVRMDGESWRKKKTLEALSRLKSMYER